MTFDSVLNGLIRLILPAAALAAAALAVSVGFDRFERHTLMQRNAQLTASALAPGSALACLDGQAGEATESACEAAIFASPQSTAAAVGYTGAWLTLLADARRAAPGLDDAFAASRRALELDRFGIAAHVLALRDGCTPERCAAFALFADANALKANMKAQAFDQYVSRHVAAWSAPAPEKEPPANPPGMSQAPEAAAPAMAAAPKPAELPGHPMSSKYSFPSAASIPPVSIMNSEPPLPKTAGPSAPPAAEQAAAPANPPVPPKRPQAQREPADTPAAR